MTRAGQSAGLAQGPQVRSKRAAVRRAIADGSVDVVALLSGAGLEEVETVALDMTVETLVRNAPSIDGATTARICATAGVQLEARLCNLTIARRQALAAALGKEIATP